MDMICGIEWRDTCDAGALNSGIDKLLNLGAKSLCVFGCDSEEWISGSTGALLKELPVPVFGGTFPNLIYGGVKRDQGALILGLSSEVGVTTISNLSNAEPLLEERVRTQCRRVTSRESLLIIIDGFAKNIELFLESLYALIGPGADIIGCGAGSLDFVQKPCVLTNEGVLQDVAIVVSLPFTLRRGVRHGWEILDGPFLVTGSRGNAVNTLNYRPAFTVYQECLKNISGENVTQDDFFSISKTFPLGMEQLGGDILVRDPVRCVGESIICVGNVPENTTVYILKGENSRITHSAGQAAADACIAFEKSASFEPQVALIFDCVSRLLFLEDQFDDELNSMHRELRNNSHIFGVLSLGEITNTPQGPLGLLNKSTVVGVF